MMEPDGAHSYVVVHTWASLEELVAHYAAQLERAGWFQTGRGADGQQAWSTWTFDHENALWSETFSVLRLAGERERYSLQIFATRTEKAGEEPPPENH